MWLIYSLIAIFCIVAIYNLKTSREGMESGGTTYTEYNSTDPTILGQQNAGNIAYLKQRVDEIAPLNQKIVDLSAKIDALEGQVNGLVQQQADYATSLAGSTPATITGT